MVAVFWLIVVGFVQGAEGGLEACCAAAVGLAGVCASFAFFFLSVHCVADVEYFAEVEGAWRSEVHAAFCCCGWLVEEAGAGGLVRAVFGAYGVELLGAFFVLEVWCC